MAITNGYATLAELRDRLSLTDAEDDAILESLITAVSRQIDRLCNRRFYGAEETRYYTAEAGGEVYIPDEFTSVTTLTTDNDGDRTYGTTWTATDYDLYPYNAALDGRAYYEIHTAPDGNYVFPTSTRGVKVTGSFGYCATGSEPQEITEACLLQCERLYKRKDSPFGVLGAAGMGQMMVIPELDPDVRMLIAAYVRLAF